MFYFHPEWALRLSRPKRDLEQDWDDLRTFVQHHQSDIRLSSVAKRLGMSGESLSMLLLRPKEKAHVRRDFDRLDACILLFMSPPFCFKPNWWDNTPSLWESP